MREIQYNERTTLAYDYVPIYASSNVVTGTKYMTALYLVQNGNKYPLGQWNEHLDEEAIKARFTEIMSQNNERQYGQQNSVLRKHLPERRSRGHSTYRAISGSIRNLQR